jgi:hypothetical protein
MKKLLVYSGAVVLLFLTGCYRDKMEELHPKLTSGCDTLTITYSKTIVPIMNSYCTSCHSGSVPAGDIALDKHDSFAAIIADGSLLGTIKFEAGFPKMPSGATEKIDSCFIKQIQAWVNAGAPNN